MTITQLKYTLSVAENGNFTVASEKCYVTQPTLSMQVQNLEEELKKAVEHIDITSFDSRKIIDSMSRMSFTSRDTANASKIFNEKE